MFWNKYKKYPLTYEGNALEGLIYYIRVYSNNKPLLFIIDSGASCSMIGNTFLKGCSYDNMGQKEINIGVGG